MSYAPSGVPARFNAVFTHSWRAGGRKAGIYPSHFAETPLPEDNIAYGIDAGFVNWGKYVFFWLSWMFSVGERTSTRTSSLCGLGGKSGNEAPGTGGIQGA